MRVPRFHDRRDQRLQAPRRAARRRGAVEPCGASHSGHAQQLGMRPLPDWAAARLYCNSKLGMRLVPAPLQPPCWTWAELTLGLFFCAIGAMMPVTCRLGRSPLPLPSAAHGGFRYRTALPPLDGAGPYERRADRSAPCRDPPDPRARDHRRAGRGARAEAGRVSAHPRPDRPGADADRARHLLGDVERALLVQELEAVAADAADHRAAGDLRARARMPASSTSATGRRWSSRWRATTTPPTSSPTRARRPGSAASCATSSPWARGRSRR